MERRGQAQILVFVLVAAGLLVVASQYPTGFATFNVNLPSLPESSIHNSNFNVAATFPVTYLSPPTPLNGETITGSLVDIVADMPIPQTTPVMCTLTFDGINYTMGITPAGDPSFTRCGHTVTGLLPGTVHSFQVFAADDAGNTGSEVQRTFTVYAPPAQIPVTGCQVLNQQGATYVLQNNISSAPEPCLSIQANNIVLDCNGKTITGLPLPQPMAIGGVNLQGRTGVTIKNCTLTSFMIGIGLSSSSNNIILNNTVNYDGEGIVLYDSRNNVIDSNTGGSNGVSGGGIVVPGAGIHLRPMSDSNQILNNRLNSNTAYGISIESSNGNVVANNFACANSQRDIRIDSMSGTTMGGSNTCDTIDPDGSMLFCDFFCPDMTPPTVTINPPLNGASITSPFTVRATVVDNKPLTPPLQPCQMTVSTLSGTVIASQSVPAVQTGPNTLTCTSTPFSVSPGSYRIDANQTDAGGNTGKANVNITIKVAEICNNGIDDDGDGYVDCNDTDCYSQPYCPGKIIGCGAITTGNKVYTLQNNITNLAAWTCITVNANNVVIDCNGYTLTGPLTGGYPPTNTGGIYVSGRTNVTVKNCIITKYGAGIYLNSGGQHTLTNNILYSNFIGINAYMSSNNVLTQNKAYNNTQAGIIVAAGSNNVLTQNNVYSNTANGIGITQSSIGNTLTSNTVNNNGQFGLTVQMSSQATTIDNTVCGNTMNDIYVDSPGSTGDNTCDVSKSFFDGSAVTCSRSCPIPITGCQVLDTYGATYALQNDIPNAMGGCFPIIAPDVTLDCNGKTITGPNGGEGIIVQASSGAIVKNCIITNFANGIHLMMAQNSQLINNTANNNTADGIVLDMNSNLNTLTGNTANNNAAYGIFIYSSSNNVLTGNTASKNAQIGIRLQQGSSNNVLNNNYACSNVIFDIQTMGNANSNTGANTCNGPSGNTGGNPGLTCTPCPFCGDSIVTPPEFCDTNGNIGCSSGYVCNSCQNCTVPSSVCGDGNVTGSEVCDTNGNIGCQPFYTCNSCQTCTPTPEACTNGIDDDGDGLIDCADSDCSSNPICPIQLTNCNQPINTPGRTYVLKNNVNLLTPPFCFSIDADNVVIDCNGYTITGQAPSDGIMASGRSNVTIKNCNITGFANGIHFNSVQNSQLIGNTVSNAMENGILIYSSSNNQLTGNTANYNGVNVPDGAGIALFQSNYNVLFGNTMQHNADGLSVGLSNTNNITNNSMCFNQLPFSNVYFWGGSSDNYGDNTCNGLRQQGNLNFDCSTSCPAFCGDNEVTPPELCDGSNLNWQTCQSQGFAGGDLACSANCHAFDTSGCYSQICGNGNVEGTEFCDSDTIACSTPEGYAGTKTCLSDCSNYGTCNPTEYCGDNIVNDGEQCDDGTASTPTSCGVGACYNTVADSCVSCMDVACTPGLPTGNDDNCNGIDEDCSGAADNNYVPTPTSCGIGACYSTGQLICVSGATQDNCVPGTPTTETCNNIDDNCDGTIDESLTQACYTGPAGTENVGICHGGTQTCMAGDWDGCIGEVTPQPEITCNNIDENCNGMIDDAPDSDGDGIDDCTDACPSVIGFKAPTEYVLEVQDFKSTASTVTVKRVFAGNTEVFADVDGKYHIPLTDSSGNFIDDNTNYNTLPKGVWVVDRQGAVEATSMGTSCAGGGSGGHGCYDNMKNAGVIVTGVKGDGLPTGTYVYYKAKATLNGDVVVRNTANNKFEKQGDGIATKGNVNQDEFTVTTEGTNVMSILAEASVRPSSDYMKITFYDLQGCPYGDITNAVMHIVDQKKSGVCGYDSRGRAKETCEKPLEGMIVKVYDRNNAAFKSAYGSNPSKNLYDNIFEADIGLVGGCTTAADGSCLAPEEYGGKFLLIGKYTDTNNSITIYQARLKNFKVKDCNNDEWDCEGSCKDEEQDDSDSVTMGVNEIVKTKNLRIVKIINKYGSVKYEAGNRQIIIGSELNVISADYVVWEGTTELYPFIFGSDTNWTVDVCVQTPAGYTIAGVMDIDGNILSTTECMQTFVEGEEKVILFELATEGTTTSALADAPDVTATVTGTHEGTAKQTNEDIVGVTETEAYTAPKPTQTPVPGPTTVTPTTPAIQQQIPITTPTITQINFQPIFFTGIILAIVLMFVMYEYKKKK